MMIVAATYYLDAESAIFVNSRMAIVVVIVAAIIAAAIFINATENQLASFSYSFLVPVFF